MALTSLRVTGSENLCLAWAGLSTDVVIPIVTCGRSLGLGGLRPRSGFCINPQGTLDKTPSPLDLT